jgi:hypothetical protein
MKKQFIPITFLFATIVMLFSFSSAHAQANIIGKPVPIPIQYTLQIAQTDFPNQMTWEDAKKACEGLGEGWRLPTKDELNEIYQTENDFVGHFHWSSTEINSYLAWSQSFSNGDQGNSSKYYGSVYVRAIRSIP